MRPLSRPRPAKTVLFLWAIPSPTRGDAGTVSLFPKPYINRGISGQTTPQMLIRFRPDVIALKPKAVVILAGTNDIAGNTGPMTLEEIEGNLMSMAELAKANGIKVVFSSVMPVTDAIRPQTERRLLPDTIRALNAWMKAYAAKTGQGISTTILRWSTTKACSRRS